MRFANIISAVYSEPWNITPAGWDSINRIVQARIFNARAEEGSGIDEGLGMSAFVNPRKKFFVDENGIAHIDIFGALGQHLSKIERACGNTGYEEIAEELDAASASSLGVLLTIDSPGGHCAGNKEAAQMIADMQIPVVAFTDSLMASAAYMLASQADMIVATGSSMVGSIGTILALVDKSGVWEKEGLKPAYITNTGGDLKSAGHPPSFSDEHLAYFQQLTDDYFSQFRDAVLSARDVSAEAMRGQAVVGRRALEYNLIDKIGDYKTAYESILKLALG
jgi:signal peptide peptidase SppA